jgi:hypothetical protein
VATGVVLWQQPWDAGPPEHAAAPIPDDARVHLAATFRKLTKATSRTEFEAAAGRSRAAKAFASTVWDARTRVGAKNVSFVYDQGGEAADRADGSTSARVKVTWRPSATSIFAGTRPEPTIVRFRLTPRPDGFDVVAATAFSHDPLPVWLAGRAHLVESGSVRVLTLGTSPACAHLLSSARSAIGAVRRVQPETHADLLVLCPNSPAVTAALLGRKSAQIAQIAAISAPLGGRSGAPSIVLNPTLFLTMDNRARQVILSHEATHVLTGVIGKKIELWVAEGYADFVALHDDRAPLSVSAGQILGEVRADGAPKKLPTNADFDEAAHGLGAVYESTWMVFRMLGAQFGDAPVTAFYRDVAAGTTVEVAAERHFGWSVEELTNAWRRYLTKSASTVS